MKYKRKNAGNKWKQYEYMKAILTLQNLPPEEYERKIKELVRILGL